MARWSVFLLSALLYVAVEGGPKWPKGIQEPTGPPPREWCPYPAEPGDRGSTGDHGQPGRVGIAGDTGYKGRYGVKGVRGYKGARGVLGRDGRKGESGWLPDGAKGRVGEKGDRGEKGEKGGHIAGNPGYPGYRGLRGDIGNDLKGYNGIPGDQGYKGPRGPKGDSIKGPRGRDGAPGRIGDRGAPGQDGDTPRYDPRCDQDPHHPPPWDRRDGEASRKRRSLWIAENKDKYGDQYIEIAGKTFNLETLLHVGFGWMLPLSFSFVLSNIYFISTLRKNKTSY